MLDTFNEIIWSHVSNKDRDEYLIRQKKKKKEVDKNTWEVGRRYYPFANIEEYERNNIEYL